MGEPTFDRDGYPTDPTLEAIMAWPWGDFTGLMAYCAEAWSDHGYFRREKPKLDEDDGCYWCCVTGGWSGNETIILALQDNYNLFWTLCWNLSWRGGYYEFHVKDVTP